MTETIIGGTPAQLDELTRENTPPTPALRQARKDHRESLECVRDKLIPLVGGKLDHFTWQDVRDVYAEVIGQLEYLTEQQGKDGTL